jgi:predicted unusual protein kinase regulating ubiquinone biosynthesis (AarF/ABC1/UbiB family)
MARAWNRREDLYIPKNFKEVSSQRVLVSEWIDGIKITHMNELRKQGYNAKSVMKTVIEAFAE